MSVLKQHTEQFLKRGVEQIQKRQKKIREEILDNLEALDRLIKTRADSSAMSDWQVVTTSPTTTIAPEYFKYGTLSVIDSKGENIDEFNIPLLLSTKVNATLLNLNDDAEKAPNLFQSLIIRILLSMRMDFAKVSIVDMDFGTDFPIVSSINNSMFKSSMYYRQDDINVLIANLAKEISEANRNFMGRQHDIEAYNTNAGERALPYHFVFIDDFPNGFSPQTIEDLLRLIDNGNANRVGIKIFINYSKKNPAPRDFDYQRFRNICFVINKDEHGSISFENILQKLPSNVVPSLDYKLPQNVDEYIEFFNGMKQKEIVYSLDPWLEELKEKDLVWSGDTSDGINVPVGYISPSKAFNFYFADDNGSCNDFFALIAGRPGYGKTVFLNNIIVSAAMKYSPDQLHLYLADFKDGVNFDIYRKLPHVKSLMLSNSKEYALRMLKYLQLEQKKRSDLFQQVRRAKGVQVTSIAAYKQLTGENLPRILLIMDEFHELFMSTDTVTLEAREKLCSGIRAWRQFGINVILCTQTISGVNFGDADKNITYRFALNLLDMDSKTVIRNDAAKSLTRKGQTIMNNTADGRVEMNVEFQSAFSKHYNDYVEYLSQLYEHKYGTTPHPFICEYGSYANIADNQQLYNGITGKGFTKNHQYCDVFIGKPDLLRPTDTRIRYQRRQNSNTLIVGHDTKTLIYNIMTQLIQLRGLSHPNSKIFLVDCFDPLDDFHGALNELTELSEVFTVGTTQNIVKYIEDFNVELERRKEEQKEMKISEERWVLAIMNSQNCDKLKSQPGKIPNSMESSPSAKKLATLLAEGAPLGMHCIIHGLSYDTMFKTNGILSSKEFPLFENIIMLVGADSANINMGGLKITPPEENGLMVVVNGKIDKEVYEQCKAYSDIAYTGKRNKTVEFMTNVFNNYKYL